MQRSAEGKPAAYVCDMHRLVIMAKDKSSF